MPLPQSEADELRYECELSGSGHFVCWCGKKPVAVLDSYDLPIDFTYDAEAERLDLEAFESPNVVAVVFQAETVAH